MDEAVERGPEPLPGDDLDDLLGLGHDAWSAEHSMPEADQRRLGELAVRAWQLLASRNGEVDRLRDLVALTVVHLGDGATGEWWDELHRRGYDRAWAHAWLAEREADRGRG